MIKNKKRPILWTIAGSDCSGGAGIQADVKTGHALGMEVCTLMTANTVQNSQKLVSVNPVPVELLQQQVETLLSDKPPAAIKIGMLANNAQLDWLVKTLKRLKRQHPDLVVVCDPVMKASVGQHLMVESLAGMLYEDLLQLVDVVTPNHCEAAGLASDFNESSPPSQWAAAMIDKGCPAVLITGGHCESADTVTDELFWAEHHLALHSPRAQTGYGHGSGCSLSTALASFLAQGTLLRDAFIQAQAFMNKAFALCPQDYSYYGAVIQPTWPVEKSFYPQVVMNDAMHAVAEAGFPELGVQKLGLYPVVDSVEWLKRLMPLGLQIIQLRLKNQTEDELRDAIQQAVELARQHPQCRLFINDHWQLAIEYGAYGVHLGQEDLQALCKAELQTIQQSGIRLGISTHGAYEFVLSQQIKPSYLAIGAIFPTRTKDMTGQIQGVDNLRHLLTLRDARNTPIVAIGGITLENADSVIATGVDSIAVVTAITEADDYQTAVSGFQSRLNA
ncbi:thiamine phosphate synthase [Thiomicrorhabdus cannonii]|uniref:thiamine phosphate synthase n=1 Tax=Thiomicrorhabdus cannonii TaxID=2748011 RepID=UPI0015C17704|nr:thiamine phosphate synthase [Thiomicrorhabdus cannonii]